MTAMMFVMSFQIFVVGVTDRRFSMSHLGVDAVDETFVVCRLLHIGRRARLEWQRVFFTYRALLEINEIYS
jgi:hypothetical protein